MESRSETVSNPAVSVLFAYPCYGSKIFVQFHEAFVRLTHLLQTKGIGWTSYSIPFDSLIPRARNACVAHFLASKHTHLMFLDTDIVFRPEDVVRMLEYDQPVVAGAYPKKGISLDRLAPIWSRDDEARSTVFERAADYVLELDQNHTKIQNNLLRVRYVGTGFMLIRRDVLERMKQVYPERRYELDGVFTPRYEGDVFYDFFGIGVVQDPALYKNRPFYVSEDWMFCRLAQRADIPVYVDVSVPLSHIGTFTFPGNYAQHLYETQADVREVSSSSASASASDSGGSNPSSNS